MNEKLFEEIAERVANINLNYLSSFQEPRETYRMTSMQAAYIEKELNSQKHATNMGYLMVPVRTGEQILYKPSMPEEESKTFAEEEETLLMEFYKDMETVKKKVSPVQFHCFLTLQQLRRHPLGRYFMSMPNPLLLKLYDYKRVIGDFLDIRIIASRLLRGFYLTKEEFQTDMISMIHRYRNYFMADKQMFDISIKFEILFWDIYTSEQKANRDAMQTFKYLIKRCKIARHFTRKPREKYPLEKKKQMIGLFNSLEVDAKRKIMYILEMGHLKNVKKDASQKVDLTKMKDGFFLQLEELLKEERKKVERATKKAEKKKKEKQVRKMERQDNHQEEGQNDIFYSDEDEENVSDRNQTNRQALQDVIDLINMEQAGFGSDDD